MFNNTLMKCYDLRAAGTLPARYVHDVWRVSALTQRLAIVAMIATTARCIVRHVQRSSMFSTHCIGSKYVVATYLSSFPLIRLLGMERDSL